MPDKPAKRNWNDVQVAIATAAIVTSIGMWNLFAAPAKPAGTQTTDPAVPPTDPPTDAPTALPHVKIIFTPGATQQTITTAALPQSQPQQQAPAQKSRSRGGGGGGAPVAHTKTS